MVRDRRNPRPRKPKLRNRLERWPGEANPNIFRVVRNADGAPTDAGRAIVPIAKQFADKRWALVGTGFFISTNGLVATARHVASDVIDLAKMQQTAALAIFQFQDNDQYLIRPIARAAWHNNADVAVLVAAEMKHKTTGNLLTNPVVSLSGAEVPLGTTVFTYAYPKSTFEEKLINFKPAFFDGRIEEYLPRGRDATFLPNPCYRTSMRIHGGASGGPVFGADGKVFGINSTGWDGTDLSYISRVNELLALEIAEVIFPGAKVARSTTISELVDHGFISMQGVGDPWVIPGT